jgi:hypothetical protein
MSWLLAEYAASQAREEGFTFSRRELAEQGDSFVISSSGHMDLMGRDTQEPLFYYSGGLTVGQ